jgi:hypothetical protein
MGLRAPAPFRLSPPPVLSDRFPRLVRGFFLQGELELPRVWVEAEIEWPGHHLKFWRSLEHSMERPALGERNLP